MPCQEPRRTICPPSSGPAIGAMAMITVSVDSVCAALVRGYRSRTMARASIGPVQAPKAWNMRHSTISPRVCDSAQPTEPITNSSTPMTSGRRRPMRSLTGPQMSCASAKPTRKLVMVSSMLPCSSRAICGIAGR